MASHRASAAIAALLLGVVTATPASAAIETPDCEAIVAWAAKAYQQDADALNRGGQPFRTGAWLLSGFKDEHWVPVFGAPFPETTPAQLADFMATAEACRRDRRAELVRLPQGHPRRNVLTAADSYLLRSFGGRQVTAQAAAPELQRYKAAYAAHAEAIAVRDAQRRQLDSLPPMLDSFAALEAMKKEPKLAALGPERAQHVQRLEQATLDLADAMVAGATEKIAEVPDGLAGLRRLVSFRAETAAEIGKLKSRNWQTFNAAYVDRLNALAAAALSEFVAELQEAPNSDDGKAAVQGAVSALFPQQPLPRNVRDYRRAATQRLAEIDEAIKVAACRETLARHELDDDAEVPLLGPAGESTLGAFVCGIAETGHAFAGYKKPGWLGSTHELTLQTPTGTTLALEMKAVEAVQGRPKMLVGTRLKHATTTQDLTVADWQGVAAGLTAYAAGGPPTDVLLAAAQEGLDSTPQGCVGTIYTQSVAAFPVVLHAGAMDRDTVARFAQLGALDLVQIEEMPSQNRSYRTYRYTLTDKARPYFKENKGLCFARLVAEDVTNVSEPFERQGRTYVTGVVEVSPDLPDFALDQRFAQAVAGSDLHRLINSAGSGQSLRLEVAFVQTDGGWKPAR